MGSIGSSQLGESQHYFPTDETTHQCCRRAKPVFGSQHGEYCRNAHVRKDVDPFKSHYLNDQYQEGIAELERLSASPFHHSSSDYQNLRPKETDHPSAQSTTVISFQRFVTNINFVPPCFSGMKKCFVRGGDVGGASR